MQQDMIYADTGLSVSESGYQDSIARKKTKRAEALSLNNPYLQHLDIAEYGSDRYKSLYTSAIEWEVNRRNLLDQRSFDSYQNQANLMRSAGLNPDLLGVDSGGSSSGGSSMPAADVTDIPTNVDKYNAKTDRINSAITGVATIGNVIGSFANGFGAITNTIQSIQNFGNTLSFNSANARIANVSADIAYQTADTGIDFANLSNRLQMAKAIADIFPYRTSKDGTAVIPELSEITSFLSDYGINDSESLSKLVHNHMTTPAVGAYIDKVVDEQARQRAHNINRGFSHYNQIEAFGRSTEYWSAQTAVYVSEMENAFNLLLSSSDFVDNTVDSMVVGSEASVKSAQDTLQHIQYNYDRFKDSVSSLNDMIAYIEEQNETLQKQPKFDSIAMQEQYTSNCALIAHMRGLMSTQIGNALPLFLNAQRNFMASISAFGSDIGPSNGWTLAPSDFNYLQFMYQGIYENPLSFDRITQPIMQGIEMYLNKKSGTKKKGHTTIQYIEPYRQQW